MKTPVAKEPGLAGNLIEMKSLLNGSKRNFW